MRRDPKLALLGALACLAGLVVTGLVAFEWPAAQARDSAGAMGFNRLDSGHVNAAADAITRLCDPRPYAALALLLVIVALVRRRWRTAMAVAVVLFAAPASAELLKPLLAAPRGAADWLRAAVSPGSWPSGHATAALTLGLVAVLVVPRRARPAVAVLGAGFAVATGVSVLVLAWHLPSDVVGGFLVAATWTLFAVAALLAAERRLAVGRPPDPAPRRRPPLWPAELLLGLGAAGALALVGLRPTAAATFVSEHTTAVVLLAIIAALALALAAGVARSVSR